MLGRLSLASNQWVCDACRAQSSMIPRFYSVSPRTISSSRSTRPANQRLSRDVGKSKPGSLSRTRPSKPFEGYKPYKTVLKKEARASHRRMSKTGTSVLSTVPIHERIANKSMTKNADGFEGLRLSSEVSEAIATGALQTLEYVTPSTIQRISIPAIVGMSNLKGPKSFLIAAETGSGKTLAYVAPILQHLKLEEKNDAGTRKVGSPRCVILLPSTELVKQVGAVVKAMSYNVKVSSSVLLPEYSFRRSKNQVLKSPLDVLVTMPHQLQSLLSEGLLTLEQTRHLIIDEADTLLDTSFSDTVPSLISGAKHLKSLIFCSATIPRSMDSYLRKNYPDIERLVSPKIHSIPRRISTKFVDVEKEFKGNKNIATHQILRDLSQDDSEPGKVKKVILFVNKRESIAEVTEYLQSKGLAALPFSRDIENREKNIAQFLTASDITEDDPDSMKVLVTTDLGSRGVDTTPVKNVIIYDTPHSTIDLLHRIGRTGRAGRRGNAFILMSKKRGEAWIKDVKHMSISGQPLI